MQRRLHLDGFGGGVWGEGRPGRLPPTLAEGERGGLGVKAPARRKPRPLALSICIYVRHHGHLRRYWADHGCTGNRNWGFCYQILYPEMDNTIGSRIPLAKNTFGLNTFGWNTKGCYTLQSLALELASLLMVSR